jgi:hypothetical protein
MERSRFRDDESASYVVPDDTIADIILSSIQMRLDWFRSAESYGMSNVLRLVIGFGIRTALWFRRLREVIREE